MVLLKKVLERSVGGAGKESTLVISNEDIDDINKVIKSLEN